VNLGKLIVDIDGITLSSNDYDVLTHPNIGGVILFSRNFTSIQQIKKLISDIKSIRSPSLIIYVDQEGQKVQRFRDGLTDLPSVSLLGKKYKADPDDAMELSRNLGWLINYELSTLGVDVNTTPVLDIDYSKSTIMENRCFAETPKIVSILSEAYIQGLKETGISCICKHYPGHGYAKADSHEILPEDNRDFKTIYTDDLLPYKKAINQNVEGIMTSHVLYKNVDEFPPTLSRKWLQILRNDLRYRGLIYSDDLSMKALEKFGNIDDNVIKSLEAGCDCIFVCNNRNIVEKILDNINLEGNYDINQKMLKLQTKLNKDNLSKNKKRLNIIDKIKNLRIKNQMEINL
tara:strand:+ start:1323 stop:2360 length:1038 start_codon:yes stop_codon:yes gene_type:complete